jgi:hypothetical protein
MNLFWKDRRALEPTASVKILYTTLEKPFLWQRDKRADRTPIFLFPKNLFFLLMNLFWKDRWALEPTASMEILYTTLGKPFLWQREKKGPIEHRGFFYP